MRGHGDRKFYCCDNCGSTKSMRHGAKQKRNSGPGMKMAHNSATLKKLRRASDSASDQKNGGANTKTVDYVLHSE